MRKTREILTGIACLLIITGCVKAQYPKVPDDIQEATNKMMQEVEKRSQKAWEEALPIIEEEARKGKPYIPWAHRPTDLPQAEIPAFPGAEGGGMYSFGGRGGKVITVNSLEDSVRPSLSEEHLHPPHQPSHPMHRRGPRWNIGLAKSGQELGWTPSQVVPRICSTAPTKRRNPSSS